MNRHYSYGIIPLKKVASDGSQWQVLLIKHALANYWSFPKGHAEADESPLEAATRELYEETGLTITKLHSTDPQRFVESYQFKLHGQLIHKTVVYFPAEVEGVIALQKEEVSDYHWVPLQDAAKWVTHVEIRHLCDQVTKMFLT